MAYVFLFFMAFLAFGSFGISHNKRRRFKQNNYPDFKPMKIDEDKIKDEKF